MTQYGVEEPREALSSLDEQEQRDKSQSYCSMAPCCETTWDEAKETAETKGELSREDVHDILQGMQDHTRACSCRLTAERVGATHNFCGQRPQGNASEV